MFVVFIIIIIAAVCIFSDKKGSAERLRASLKKAETVDLEYLKTLINKELNDRV
jgi:hypothetical protein